MINDLASSDQEETSDEEKQTNNFLRIDYANFQANDIQSLAKLAEINPELAEKIVDNAEKQSQRESFDWKLGLIISALMGAIMVFGGVFTVIQWGWWQSLIFILSMLGVSHLLGVVLKGEWSDTSWLKHFFGSRNANADTKE